MRRVESQGDSARRLPFVRFGGRLSSVVLIATAVVCLAVRARTLSLELFYAGDNTGYLVLAKALARGEGLHDIAHPDAPALRWWPPGFPAAVALFVKTAGDNWRLLKVLIITGFTISLLLFAFMLVRRGVPLWAAAVILAILGIHSEFHYYLSYLYSEAFYTALTLVFFFAFDRRRERMGPVEVLVLSVAAVYIVSVRNIGLALPAALTVYLFAVYRCDPRRTMRYAWLLPLILYGTYHLWLGGDVGTVQAFYKGGPGYLAAPSIEETGVVERAWSLLVRYGDRIAASLRGYALTLVPQVLVRSFYDLWLMDRLKALIMALITGTVAAGWAATFRRFPLINLYVGFYLAALQLYGALYPRLLVPLVPFIVLYVYGGLNALAQRLFSGRLVAASCVVLVPMALIGADNLYRISVKPYDSMPVRIDDNRFNECLRWLIEEAEPGSHILTLLHHYVFLMRGEPCYSFEDRESPEDVVRRLREKKIDYMLVSPRFQRKTDRFMRHHPEAVALYSRQFSYVCGAPGDSTYVVRFLHESGEAAGEDIDTIGNGQTDPRLHPHEE